MCVWKNYFFLRLYEKITKKCKFYFSDFYTPKVIISNYHLRNNSIFSKKKKQKPKEYYQSNKIIIKNILEIK